MSIPKKHHYLPQWMQARWADPKDRRVFEFTRPFKDINVRKVFPSETGYEQGLYAVPSRADPRDQQRLELGFMSPVDRRAAEALSVLENAGKHPRNSHVSSDWSRFVLSMMHRTPERLDFIRRKLRAGDIGTGVDIDESYATVKGPDDPETLADYRANAGEALYEELEAALLRRMIDSPRIGPHLNNMQWSFGAFPNPTYGLLLSDSPVLMSNGLNKSESFIIMPVGPRKFFIAVNDSRTSAAFTEQPDHRKLERAINDALVRQASKLVIGASAAHRRFIDKRLGRGGASRTPGRLERMTWKAPL